ARRDALRPRGAEPRRLAALLGLLREARADRRRVLRGGVARHRHRGRGQPPHALLDDEALGRGVLGRGARGDPSRRLALRAARPHVLPHDLVHRRSRRAHPRDRHLGRAALRPRPPRRHRPRVGRVGLRRGGDAAVIAWFVPILWLLVVWIALWEQFTLSTALAGVLVAGALLPVSRPGG